MHRESFPFVPIGDRFRARCSSGGLTLSVYRLPLLHSGGGNCFHKRLCFRGDGTSFLLSDFYDEGMRLLRDSPALRNSPMVRGSPAVRTRSIWGRDLHRLDIGRAEEFVQEKPYRVALLRRRRSRSGQRAAETRPRCNGAEVTLGRSAGVR